MSYDKIVWNEDKAITPNRLNHMETQYEEAIAEAENLRKDPDKEIVLEVVSEFPSHEAGRLIYYTNNGEFYGSDGSNWIKLLKSEGTAETQHVLEGETFSNDSEVGLTGTMPNIGEENFTPSTTQQPISQGYHNGNGTVNTLGGNATTNDVHPSVTFSSDSEGRAVSGTMNTFSKVYTPGTSNQSIDTGYHSGSEVQGDSDLQSENIKEDVSIFGVLGELKEEGVQNTGTIFDIDNNIQNTSFEDQKFDSPSQLGIFMTSSAVYAFKETSHPIVTGGQIDLTDWDKLKIEWGLLSGQSNVSAYLQIHDDKTELLDIDNYTEEVSRSGTGWVNETDEIDISEYNGSWYISVYGTGWDTDEDLLELYKLWLE